MASSSESNALDILAKCSDQLWKILVIIQMNGGNDGLNTVSL
jgi:uncharacterized protein (DUF1501 family)